MEVQPSVAGRGCLICQLLASVVSRLLLGPQSTLLGVMLVEDVRWRLSNALMWQNTPGSDWQKFRQPDWGLSACVGNLPRWWDAKCISTSLVVMMAREPWTWLSGSSWIAMAFPTQNGRPCPHWSRPAMPVQGQYWPGKDVQPNSIGPDLARCWRVSGASGASQPGAHLSILMWVRARKTLLSSQRQDVARQLEVWTSHIKPLNLVCGGMQWALLGETQEHDHRYLQLFSMSEWCTCLRQPQACPQLANYRASLQYDSYNLIYFVLMPLCPTGCVVHSHSADQDQQE